MDVNLIMFKENGLRRDFSVKAKGCTVGRREDCDLRIPVPAVSRKHCKFLKSDNGLELKDLGSSNGTFVNNQRVQETILKAGDRVVVGPVVFIVQIDGDPPEPKPVRTRLAKMAPAAKAGAATAGAGPKPSAADKSAGVSDEELDPIAALEALAGAAGDEPTVDVEIADEPLTPPQKKKIK